MTNPHRTIRLGYHGSLVLPKRIATASGRPELVEFTPYEMTDPFRALRAGDLDVMIVKFGVREADLTCSSVLGLDPRAALIGATHPLARRCSLSVEDLADFEGFRCPSGFPSYIWDEVVPPSTPAGRPVRRCHDLASTSAVMDLVASGRAVHLSVLSLADIAPPTVRVIPVADLPPAPVALAWCRLTGQLRTFVTTAEWMLAESRS